MLLTRQRVRHYAVIFVAFGVTGGLTVLLSQFRFFWIQFGHFFRRTSIEQNQLLWRGRDITGTTDVGALSGGGARFS